MPDNDQPLLHVCVTCKNAQLPAPGEDDPAHGRVLFERIAAKLQGDAEAPIAVEPIVCMANCEQGCSVAISAPGKWSYLLGHLTPDHAEDLITYGAAFRASKNGTVFRSKRPDSLYDSIVARFPGMLAKDEDPQT